MTVCIGALCDEGRAVIVVSDRMVTFGESIEFEPELSKIDQPTPMCAGMIAGTSEWGVELLSRVRTELEKRRGHSVADVVTCYKELYIQYRLELAEDYVLRWRGLSLEDFYRRQRELDPELVGIIDQGLQNFAFDVEVLIAGVDQGRDEGGQRGHLYILSQPGTLSCSDDIGFAAIGIGEQLAQFSFIDRRYTWRKSIGEALYIAYESKKRAEQAPGVGRGTDICLVTGGGIRSLTGEEMVELSNIHQELASQWEKIFQEKQERLVKVQSTALEGRNPRQERTPRRQRRGDGASSP